MRDAAVRKQIAGDVLVDPVGVEVVVDIRNGIIPIHLRHHGGGKIRDLPTKPLRDHRLLTLTRSLVELLDKIGSAAHQDD